MEFVDGWYMGHTLGEGAYGEVKLVMNKISGEAVAMKMIDLLKHPDARENIRKETVIHRLLKNPNIISYFGQRSEPNVEYIFLEYAAGGELFDRIEPDIGMPQDEARKYFKQLISGVEYLHEQGVVHRDLKPENLLLDDKDNLKISDFGFATVFRHNGRTRKLEKRCGTLPYVAPEVLSSSYDAEPIDVWSCGIILVALLAGELPWDRADSECPEFIAWEESKYRDLTPWKKLDKQPLELIRNILKPQPASRYTISQIKTHSWYRNRSDGDRHKPSRLMYLSQPEMMNDDIEIPININERPGFSFSQPIALGDLLLSQQVQTQTQNTQSSQNIFQKLVRRMTRFFVKTDYKDTVEKLIEVLKVYKLSYRINDGIITISTVDKRKTPLVFKAIILEMDNILIDFRLSKGDGLEFKRRFINIKESFNDLIIKGTVTFPIVSSLS